MLTLRILSVLLILSFGFMPMKSFAKDGPQPADLFDFWVGDWDLTWKKADGTPATGRNTIVKILDGRVIEEQFEGIGTANSPGLKGRSLSVLHQGSKIWKQTWADSQGSYITLTAQVDGDKRIFITDPVKKNEQVIQQRMVFHDIKKDSFTWDWEGTTDGGKTWKNQWHIEYKRRAKV